MYGVSYVVAYDDPTGANGERRESGHTNKTRALKRIRTLVADGARWAEVRTDAGDVIERFPKSTRPSPATDTGKIGTMPYAMWKNDVITKAHVAEEDAHEYVGRERLERWYRDEMPVWMAAESVLSMVTIGKRHAKADRELDFMRNMGKAR